MGEGQEYAKPAQKRITPEVLPPPVNEGATKKGDIQPPVNRFRANQNTEVDTKKEKNVVYSLTEVEVKQVQAKMETEGMAQGKDEEQRKKEQSQIKVGMSWNEVAEKLRDFGYTETLKWANEQIQKLNEQKKSSPKGGGTQKTQVEQGEDRKRKTRQDKNRETALSNVPKTKTPGEAQAEENIAKVKEPETKVFRDDGKME